MVPPAADGLILGEHARKLDERYRLSLPTELAEPLLGESTQCVLSKERPGCLSVWNAIQWNEQVRPAVDLVTAKLRAGRLGQRASEVQHLARLLSTRHRALDIAGKGRLVIPEGFREFLQVDKGGDVIVVGAGVCLEIWKPETWLSYLDRRMPQFRRLLDRLSE